MADQVNKMNAAANASSKQASAAKDRTKTESAAAKALSGSTKLDEAAAKQEEMSAHASKMYKAALDQGKQAVTTFVSAVIDSTPGMSKYASSVRGGIGAVSSVASTLGPLGNIFGVFLNAISLVTTAAFKYNDNVVKAYDDISKTGAGIGTSSEGITKLGREAGISSQNLGMLTKNVASLGASVVSLGGTAAGGVDTFGKMIAVGDKTLQQYRKLGYTQEELIASQAKFVELQAQSGANLRKSPEQLQKASLQYIDNLNLLSELTGLNAKKQQELMAQAQAQENFNAHINELERDKDNATTDAEKEQIQLIIDSKKEYAMFAQQLSPAKSKAYLEAISTKGDPVFTESSAQLARSNPEVIEQVRKLNKGINQTGALIQSNVKAVNDYEKNFGEAGYALGETSRGTQAEMGVGNAEREFRTKFGNLTQEQLDKERKSLAAQQEVVKNQSTGAMADRAKLDSQERQLQLTFDTMMKELSAKLMDMVLKFIPMVTKAFAFIADHAPKIQATLLVLMASIGVMGTIAGVGKVVQTARSIKDGIKGLFGGEHGKPGSSTNPAYIESASGSLGGNRNQKTSGKGSERDTKTGRFKKKDSASVEDDNDPKSIKNVLKDAAKNAGPIIAGGAALGSAIAALGAGIAGAVWITGKALPTFADGMKAFNDVNGKNLKECGIGLAALGAGLIAMQVDAILKLFTIFKSKDPLEVVADQLKEFQNQGIDAEKVSNGAAALTAFSRAMASTAVSSSLGSMVSGISSFFVKEPPYQKLEAFSRLNVDPIKTSENAIAFREFASVLSMYKGSASVIGALSSLAGSAINKLFRQDGPIEAFTNFATSTDKIGPNAIKNADAFFKFASAMSMLSQQSGTSAGAAATGTVVGAAKTAGAAVSSAAGSIMAGAKELVTGEPANGIPTSEKDLKNAGLTIKQGDVHGEGNVLDPRVLPFAKQIQQNIPGFSMFTGFNDRYHHTLGKSRHTLGKAIDFVLVKKPSDEEGKKLVKMLKDAGATVVIDEYNHPSGAATGGHIHVQFAEKGGIFKGPATGYPMVLHGNELVIPMDPNSMLKDLSTKDAVKTVQQSMSSSGSESVIESSNEMMEMLIYKFDKMLNVLHHSQDTGKKVLTSMRM